MDENMVEVSTSQSVSRSVEWAEVGKSTLAVGSIALQVGVSDRIKGKSKGSRASTLFFLTPQNVRSHLMLSSL